MKLSELMELYALFNGMVNNGEKVNDFGVTDSEKGVYIETSGGLYTFKLDNE